MNRVAPSSYQAETIATYDKIASPYTAGRAPHYWVEEFDLFSHIVPGKNVIDLGCGSGRDARVFVDHGFLYHGIDASDGMLQMAKQAVPEATFSQMDMLSLGFPDKTFDGFWAAASFLHFSREDLPLALREASRVLKDEGVGFISMKDRVGDQESYMSDERYDGMSRYFSYFTSEEYVDLLNNHGFTVIASWTHPATDRPQHWLSFFVQKQI